MDEATQVISRQIDTAIDGKIAGALFDFLGFLTTRDVPTTFGASHDATPAIELLAEWAKTRGLSLDDADVGGWNFPRPNSTMARSAMGRR